MYVKLLCWNFYQEEKLQTTLDSLEQELKKVKMAHTESIKAYENRVAETQEGLTRQMKSLQENYDRALVENQHLSEVFKAFCAALSNNYCLQMEFILKSMFIRYLCCLIFS